MAALTIGLGYFTQQHEFPKIIGFYSPFFLLYLLVSNTSYLNPHTSLKFWLALAILLRLLLVFSEPNLSNDVFRFIWDGRLLVQGFNPFDHLPLYYLENNVQVEGIDRALFEAFDAKNTYTVYPPVAQAQFASACWLFPKNIYWCTVVMKFWLFAFEVGSIFLIVKLLRRFQMPARNVLLYALNPLIIVEITGNLHFEGAMIFFLLLALWLLGDLTNFKNLSNLRLTASAVAFALSICSKLLTLLFLPFFIKRMGWGRSLRYFTITGVVTALLFLPIVNATFLANFGDSLNLYFQKLEYNASLYYVLRWLGLQILGYNPISFLGPLLGAVAMGGILWMAASPPRRIGASSAPSPGGEGGRTAAPDGVEKNLKEKFGLKLSLRRECKQGSQPSPPLLRERGQSLPRFVGGVRPLPEFWLFAICLYLACTTTMHPWYTALPVVLCVFTKWRFPIVWSGLIFLTYVNYSYEPYRENLWVVAFEYLVVAAWFAWEWRSNSKKVLSL